MDILAQIFFAKSFEGLHYQNKVRTKSLLEI